MIDLSDTLATYIRTLQNYDVHFHSHFADELAILLEPGQEDRLRLFADMLRNDLLDKYDIIVRQDFGPMHPNQLLTEQWRKSREMQPGDWDQTSRNLEARSEGEGNDR